MASILEQLKEIGALAGVQVTGVTVQEALVSFKAGLTAKNGKPVSKEPVAPVKAVEEEPAPIRTRRSKANN